MKPCRTPLAAASSALACLLALGSISFVAAMSLPRVQVDKPRRLYGELNPEGAENPYTVAWQMARWTREGMQPPRIALNAEFGTGPWNLTKVFTDEPKGAYLDLLNPLTYAAMLTYTTTNGTMWATEFQNGTWNSSWGGASDTSPGNMSGGEYWERLYAVEQNSEWGGPHMRAIVDNKNKRVILAFRGACLDPAYPQCRNDMCAVAMARQTPSYNFCFPWQMNATVYVQQAADLVEKAINFLGPDYAVMVTGHSLGGLMTLSIDAVKKLNAQYVALEPTPYGNVIRKLFGLTDEQIRGFDTSRRYAVYDPTDLASTSFAPLDVLRPSTTVCVYNGVPPPKECQDCAKQRMQANGNLTFVEAMAQCLAGPIDPKLHYSRCKDACHFLENYVDVLLKLKKEDGSVQLPDCTVVGSCAGPAPVSMPTVLGWPWR